MSERRVSIPLALILAVSLVACKPPVKVDATVTATPTPMETPTPDFGFPLPPSGLPLRLKYFECVGPNTSRPMGENYFGEQDIGRERFDPACSNWGN